MYPVRTIHRFWAGSPMPSKYQDFGREWEALNPEWTVRNWNEVSAMAVLPPHLGAVIQDLYRRDDGRLGIELYVQMADVIGYWLVYKFGGVYVNCDIQPLKPIEPFLPPQAWAGKENNTDDRIVNAAIGAPNPADPFWIKVIDELPFRYFSDPSNEMVMTTGPQLLTDIAHANPGELFVFPTETFNPVHWSQIEPGGDASKFEYPDSAIAVHHWGHKLDGRSNHVETATQR